MKPSRGSWLMFWAFGSGNWFGSSPGLCFRNTKSSRWWLVLGRWLGFQESGWFGPGVLIRWIPCHGIGRPFDDCFTPCLGHRVPRRLGPPHLRPLPVFFGKPTASFCHLGRLWRTHDLDPQWLLFEVNNRTFWWILFKAVQGMCKSEPGTDWLLW